MTPSPEIMHLLPLLRCFVASVAQPNSHRWTDGFEEATIIFGEARGLSLAHKLQKALWALMQARPAPIEAQDDMFATQLTNDEALILELLSAMQQDNTQRARDVLALLTYGRLDARVIQLSLDLAGALSANPPRREARPQLRVV